MLSLHNPAFAEGDFDYPLAAARLRLSDVPAVRRAVVALTKLPVTQYNIAVSTNLPQVLDAAARDERLIDPGTLLVSLQLALLAWLVLFQAAADAIEARADEIAMAKLRGYSPLATIRFGMAEPLIILLTAVPLGLLAAWGVTHAFAASVLVPGVPVVVTAAPVLAAVAAFGGGLIAAVLAGHRTLTRPVVETWRHATRRPARGGRTLLVDGVLAAAATVGLVLLRAGHRSGSTTDPAALLAPGLLLFAVAVVGVRLLPLASRGIARVTRATHRMGSFLASRQIARRPVGIRLAALLAVAAGLATFAVAGETVATTNRDLRAAAEIGADRVVAVQFPSQLDPVLATHRADPGGTWAMAAATWLPDGGNSVNGTVLGVDPARLAAVGNLVSGGPDLAQLATDITGTAPPVVTFRAVRLRVHLTAARLSGNVRPRLQINLRTLTNPQLDIEAGAIHDGRGTYTAKAPCVHGCTLRGLTWDRPITATAPMHGQITFTRIDVASRRGWRSLHLDFGGQRDWRAAAPQGQARDHLTALRRGVRDRFANRNGGYGGIVYGSSLSPLPAVATARALTPGADPRHLRVVDYIGATATLKTVHQTRLLPAVLDFGVATDVRYLEAELPGFRGEPTWHVWLSSTAPPDALQRLQAAGLQVQDVHTEAQRINQLARQPPALALLLLLAGAIAGALLAAAGTAIAVSASSRRRSFEIAALRAVGVARPALVRAAILEHIMLLGAAVLLGVPTGLLATRLAMPVIPEFSDSTPVVLHYVPRWLPSLSFVAAFIALLTITAVAGAHATMRQAVPARLREGAQ